MGLKQVSFVERSSLSWRVPHLRGSTTPAIAKLLSNPLAVHHDRNVSFHAGMVMWEVAMGKAPFEEDKKQLSPVLLVVRLLLGQRPEFSPHHDHVSLSPSLSPSSFSPSFSNAVQWNSCNTDTTGQKKLSIIISEVSLF